MVKGLENTLYNASIKVEVVDVCLCWQEQQKCNNRGLFSLAGNGIMSCSSQKVQEKNFGWKQAANFLSEVN